MTEEQIHNCTLMPPSTTKDASARKLLSRKQAALHLELLLLTEEHGEADDGAVN